MNFARTILSRAGVLFPVAAVLLVVKLRFYLTASPITGWDTIGHAHLADVYRTFFANFSSLGYDPDWFFGFPAFYFYPPAFYFFVAQLSFVPGVSSELAFHLGILASVLFFAYNYLRWILLFLPPTIQSDPWLRAAFAYGGLTLYISYAGDGLQGAGLLGVLDGTIVSGFAHGVVLMVFTHLELYRRRTADVLRLVQCVFSLALLVLTHLLSTVFCFLLLALYLFVHRRQFTWTAAGLLFFAPFLIAFPIPYNILVYGHFVNGSSSIQQYPALLYIIGTDFYDRLTTGAPYVTTLVREIFIHFKWLNLLPVVGLGLAIRQIFVRKRGQAPVLFLIAACLILVWMSQDASFSYIFYPLGIHWYRVFDLFYGLLILCGLLGFAPLLTMLRRRDRWRARLVAGFVCACAVLRFLAWDPVAHAKYPSMRLYDYSPDPAPLETFLAQIPRGSVILPEKLRNKDLYGSPHALDYFIQKHGHRNALGLTIESALTPSVTYAWLASGMPQIFEWGIDARWNTQLYHNATLDQVQTGLPAYLRRAGVNFVLGRSPEAFAYLSSRPEFTLAFSANSAGPSPGIFAFRVNDSRPTFRAHNQRPIGYLSLGRVRAIAAVRSGGDARGTVRNFLFHSNQLRLHASLKDGPPMINLDPYYLGGTADEVRRLTKDLSALLIFHDGPGLMPSTMSHGLTGASNVPITILVNFQKTAEDVGPTRYLYTNLQVPEENAALFAARADDVKATALVPLEFSHRRLRLPVPPGSACVPIEIGLSHFPDWRIEDDSRFARDSTPADCPTIVYQTDTNQMLAFAPAGREIELEFHASFARTLTVLLYLVSLTLLGLGMYRIFERVRGPGETYRG